eukprot:gene12549-13737_t
MKPATAAAVVQQYEEDIEQEKSREMEDEEMGRAVGERNQGKVYPEQNKGTLKTESSQSDFDDYEVQSKFSSYYEYWRYRYNRSNIKKMMKGRNLTVEEADEAVNVFSLVNALILTVPFGLMLDLNNELWEKLFAVDWGDCFSDSIDYRYRAIMDCMFACAYASMISLIIAIFYYLFRPKGKYFHEWWFRGRWCLLMIFIGTGASIVGLLTLFGTVVGVVDLPYDRNTCRYTFQIDQRYKTALSILCFCVVASIGLMG